MFINQYSTLFHSLIILFDLLFLFPIIFMSVIGSLLMPIEINLPTPCAVQKNKTRTNPPKARNPHFQRRIDNPIAKLPNHKLKNLIFFITDLLDLIIRKKRLSKGEKLSSSTNLIGVRIITFNIRLLYIITTIGIL